MKHRIWQSGIAAVLFLSGCNFNDRIPVEMVQTLESQPMGNESSLAARVSLDIGTLEVSGESAAKLYEIDLEYDKAGYAPEIDYNPGNDREGTLSLKLESLHRGGLRGERHSNRLRLNLTERIPINLQIRTGVGDARLALSKLQLNGLDLEAGVGGARLSVYEPNPVICDEIRLRNGVGSLDAVGLGNLNFRRLDFEGGVGGANLDFSGEWKQNAEVRIEVGIGGVTARIPRGVGVRLTAEKHFLSGFSLEGFRRESGEDYFSDNYDSAKVRISLVVKTGIGGFKISWI